MPRQLAFCFRKEKVNKQLVTHVKSVALAEQGKPVGPAYVFPDSLKDKSIHEDLFKIKKVSTACEQMVSQRNNLVVTLENTVIAKYLDSDDTFVFRECYLNEEQTDHPESKEPPQKSADSNTAELLKMIADLRKRIDEKKKIAPKDAVKHMQLDEYSGADDGADWLSRFEAECRRIEITEDADRVGLLKALMKGSAKSWADALEKKFNDDEWSNWKSSFEAIFTRKNWTTVKKAYEFKYLGGSLTEYAIEKQRKLLNVDKNLSERTMVDQIAIGLPDYARDKLDRDEIKTANQIFSEIAKIDVRKSSYNARPSRAEPKGEQKAKQSGQQKIDDKWNKPCVFCRHLGYRDNLHLGRRFRHENGVKNLMVNLTESSADQELQALMNLNIDDEKKSGN